MRDYILSWKPTNGLELAFFKPRFKLYPGKKPTKTPLSNFLILNALKHPHVFRNALLCFQGERSGKGWGGCKKYIVAEENV